MRFPREGYIFAHYFCTAFATGKLLQDVSSSLAARSDLDTIDSGSDASLKEWLKANQRMSSDALQKCPSLCSGSNDTTYATSWFLYSDFASLASCNETMLLDLAVQPEPGQGSVSEAAVRACHSDYNRVESPQLPEPGEAALCSTPNHDEVRATLKLSTSPSAFKTEHLLSAGQQVANFISFKTPSCDRNTAAFGYFQSATIGLFSGIEVHQQGLTSKVLENLLQTVKDSSASKTTIVQLCKESGRAADYAIGIISSSSKNLPLVFDAVRSWQNGKCFSAAAGDSDWMTITLRVPAIIRNSTAANNSATAANYDTSVARGVPRTSLVARGICKVTVVKSGDGCYNLAKACKISENDLKKYNPKKDFCSTLVPGQKVCCSAGTLPDSIPPGNQDGTCKTRQVISGDNCGTLASKCGLSGADFMKVNTKANLCSTLAVGQSVCCTRGKFPDHRPKPNADGSCATYTTTPQDSCSSIAANRDLTVTDIDNFNKQTWGWKGCKNVLFVGFKLCVSTGSPPMPAPVANAVCGPTVPGTKPPAKGADLAKLNPCPLKVCCNVWGQCGLTDDFCLEKKSDTGAPGTSGLKNGCISNCGTGIIKGSPPAKKIHVAYFEAWNKERKCLTMDVGDIDTSSYSHVHFAFAGVTPDYNIDIIRVKEQFDRFKGMTGVKKIISFGGWDFSTKPGTFSILREAVKPGNRDVFQKNIIAFVNQNGLDGVDIDWEYPGAPDIPDIPAGSPEDGMNYYQFLSNLKVGIGSSKSVSFAAPASYWYLRAFPIEQMAAKLDYIIYMTYDLHGQWDYGNKWTSPGCPTGNCLRSHVNITETNDALSMITRAGVPSNKIVVGIASYGRSFKMAQAGCTGPTCKFTGGPRLSNAAKGRCTDTAGYISNAEIEEILRSDKVTTKWDDAGARILVYDNTEWVSYMDKDLKSSRSKYYESLNFAGTTDWAVDLEDFNDGSDDDDPDWEPTIDPNYFAACSADYRDLGTLESKMGSFPGHCIDTYIVKSQYSVMGNALKRYKDLINHGYDARFKTYQDYIKEQAQSQIDAFMASDKVWKYFSCRETKTVTCCDTCSNVYCGIGCSNDKGCANGRARVDVKCPQEEEQISMIDARFIPNVTFTLRDREGFWYDIGKQYGIEESWVTFGRRLMRLNNGCQYVGTDIRECEDKNSNWWYDYPNAEDKKIKVANPKDMIGDSHTKLSNLLHDFKIVQDNVDYSSELLWSDIVDSISLPALSARSAVESMEQVVEEAKKIEKAKREEMILSFITGILMWLPVLGAAAEEGGALITASFLRLIGGIGDAGMAMYDIVKDPKHAYSAVFDFLGGLGGGKNIGKVASARRGIKGDDLAKLGNIKKDLDRIDHLRGGVCRRK